MKNAMKLWGLIVVLMVVWSLLGSIVSAGIVREAVAPTANFAATTVCFCTNVAFTDTSTPRSGTINSWLWDFGDASPLSYEQHPEHHYAGPGMYMVTLTVTDDMGYTNTTSKSVTVYANPVANFAAPSVCNGTAVQFTDWSEEGSGAIINWTWDFGDLSPLSYDRHPTHTYAGPVGYPVTLTVTDENCCTNTTSKVVTICENPAVSICCYTQMCNLTVDFEGLVTGGTPPYTYSWDFDGDNVYELEGNYPNTTWHYPSADSYIVTLEVVDAHGCSDETSFSINLYCGPQTDALFFTYGWNAISAPVFDGRSMSKLFVGTVPGYYAVYSWNSDFQCWVTEDLSQPLNPAKGYFIWATDDAEIELTGEPANYSPSLVSGWNFIGVGANPVNLSSDQYVYQWNQSVREYESTHYMEPGKGYFVWPGDEEGTLAPPDPENKRPVLVIDVRPISANVSEEITVNTLGTYDEPSDYPLTISCDWDDGTVETEYMANETGALIFKHTYIESGIYTITVTAWDKWTSDTKTATVTIYPLSSNTIYVPDDYEKIQWAVDNASVGDTIIVRDGLYYENVKVNKSHLTIQTENGSANCVVQTANQSDHVFEMTADYVNLIGFTVRDATNEIGHSGAGIYLCSASYCNISYNNGSNKVYGILVENSNSNVISNNNNSENFGEIGLANSNSNKLINNVLEGPIEIWGNSVEHYTHEIDASNTVNGRPVYYWNDIEGGSVPDGAGQVILVNCTNVAIETQNLTDKRIFVAFCSNTSIKNNNWVTGIWPYWSGIMFHYSNDNLLSNNTISSDYIWLFESSNNTISNNNISNMFGIVIYYGANNIILNNYLTKTGIYTDLSFSNCVYLNNFINSTIHISSNNSTNIWNSTNPITYTYNGTTYTSYLGNYWCDYSDVDVNGDGIWDDPYSINGEKDYYPLKEGFENYILENLPPNASFNFSPENPKAGDMVIFNASSSYDLDGVILLYEWDWEGDGDYDEYTDFPTAIFWWPIDGEYTVRLRVTDDREGTATFENVLTVAESGTSRSNIILAQLYGWIIAAPLTDKQTDAISRSTAPSPVGWIWWWSQEHKDFVVIDDWLNSKYAGWCFRVPADAEPLDWLEGTDFEKCEEADILYVLNKEIDSEETGVSGMTYREYLLGIVLEEKLVNKVFYNPTARYNEAMKPLFKYMFSKDKGFWVSVDIIKYAFSPVARLVVEIILLVKDVLAVWELFEELEPYKYANALGKYFLWSPDIHDPWNEEDVVKAINMAIPPSEYSEEERSEMLSATHTHFYSLWENYGQYGTLGYGLNRDFRENSRKEVRQQIISLLEEHKGKLPDREQIKPWWKFNWPFWSTTNQYGDFCTDHIDNLNNALIEIRVIDSEGRTTGEVNGEIREDIINSVYDEAEDTVTVFNPSDSCRYIVVGITNGSYGLNMYSLKHGLANDFSIVDVPTQNNATHQYTVNWTAVSDGKVGGVILDIDSDGDGIFEQNITIEPPIVNFSYKPLNPFVNQTITFNALNSTDLDGYITSYEWVFGDGTNGTGEITTHSYLSAGDYGVLLTIRDDDGAMRLTFKIVTVGLETTFDTNVSSNPYPSISGIHNGTIAPSNNLTVSKLYTYPCPGTGGHTEYAKISNESWSVETLPWTGYAGDWHNLTFNNSFPLYANETYNYTIKTGSYPQIVHESPFNATGGVITCTSFEDINGKRHGNWIPAIRLNKKVL